MILLRCVKGRSLAMLREISSQAIFSPIKKLTNLNIQANTLPTFAFSKILQHMFIASYPPVPRERKSSRNYFLERYLCITNFACFSKIQKKWRTLQKKTKFPTKNKLCQNTDYHTLLCQKCASN